MTMIFCKFKSLSVVAAVAVITSLAGISVPCASHAQEAMTNTSASDIPLAVIRFNQPKVFFEKPLQNAIAKAVQRKASVMFDVVSYVPQGKDQSALDAAASRQQQQVISAMRSMGVNATNIQTSSQADANVQFHEVQIFIH